MATSGSQIFAFSGILQSSGDTRTNADLTDYALGLSGKESGQRVCYVPTAVGDSPVAVQAKSKEFAELRPDVAFSVLTLFNQPNVPDIRDHLLTQDVILVEGGSVANLMAVWRVHGVDKVMRECWQNGVVLAGASAGSICWHTGGPTDSFGDTLAPFDQGLGLLPFSNGVHDDFRDQPRKEAYRGMVASKTLGGGYATEDGVGLHYVGTKMNEAVSIRAGARAWTVQPTSDCGYLEEAITPRLI
ncbi:peptidase E [Psychromicrobium silvestre]|uniref:Type 1 glutamine amidotransferase-like domain-containing protein n=1 Tax=Psychromicrobium silvestre TaxID=1645614 RepID=UPI0015CCF185|nr:peptidase E [Psychromicrobium silvestre]